jgi:hypothetical protein
VKIDIVTIFPRMVEAGLAEEPIEPFALGLMLHERRARHDHRSDARVDFAAPHHGSGDAQVFQWVEGDGSSFSFSVGHRLPLEDMEYTTMPAIMGRLKDRFRAE